MTKKKTAKKTMKKSVRTTSNVAPGIDKYSPSNTYRARKVVKGKRLSRNFDKLKDAKGWLNSL